MIPAEAVEAAAFVISYRMSATEDDWQTVARAALEAAAPHMLLSRNQLMDIIADAYGDKNQGHLSVKAADAIRDRLREYIEDNQEEQQ